MGTINTIIKGKERRMYIEYLVLDNLINGNKEFVIELEHKYLNLDKRLEELFNNKIITRLSDNCSKLHVKVIEEIGDEIFNCPVAYLFINMCKLIEGNKDLVTSVPQSDFKFTDAEINNMVMNLRGIIRPDFKFSKINDNFTLYGKGFKPKRIREKVHPIEESNIVIEENDIDITERRPSYFTIKALLYYIIENNDLKEPIKIPMLRSDAVKISIREMLPKGIGYTINNNDLILFRDC